MATLDHLGALLADAALGRTAPDGHAVHRRARPGRPCRAVWACSAAATTARVRLTG